MRISAALKFLSVSTLAAASMAASAATTIADFESGIPSGWTTTGSPWTVGGTTGTSPNISPPQGSQFARSGAPNVLSGPLAESNTGTMSSGPLSVTFDSISWLATGWSGQFGDGSNRFEILNAGQTVIGTTAAPLSDSWSTLSVNLLSLGLSPGGTFYFRAVDTNASNNYAWLAMDNLQFVGAPVPEPDTVAMLLVGLGAMVIFMRRRSRSGG